MVEGFHSANFKNCVDSVENLKETIWACRIGAAVIHVQEQLQKTRVFFLIKMLQCTLGS